MGADLLDTSSELAGGIGIAATGTILAALFAGSITAPNWDAEQVGQLRAAVTIAGLTHTVLAAALVVFGIARARTSSQARAPAEDLPSASA